MKKIALFFVLIFAAQAGNAFVDTQYMKSPNYLANTNYSTEMSRMIDTVSGNPYREPYVESRSPIGLLKRAHAYIVPGQNNNLDFYNHTINYEGVNWRDY